MKKEKGKPGYLEKRKRFLLFMALFCLADIAAVVLLGVLVTGSKKNLFTVAGILFCLPMANFVSQLFVLLPFKSLAPERREALLSAAGPSPLVCDCVITSEDMILPVQAAVLHENGIAAFLGEKGKYKDVKSAQAYLERALRAGGTGGHVHLFTDWQAFLRRLEELPPQEETEKQRKQRDALLAVSV